MAYLSYLAALLLFGSNGVVASGIRLPSHSIVLLRSWLGSLFLLAVCLVRRTSLRLRGRDMLYIALSGVAMAADWLLLFEAYARIGVSLGMILNYCGPLLVMLLSVPVLHERLTWRKCVTLGVAFVGVALISGGAISAKLDMLGLACAALSAFAYAGMVLFNRLATQAQGMENACWQLWYAAATVTLFACAGQGLPSGIARCDWLPILWLGVVNTGLACFLYFSSLPRLPVQTVAVCGYLEPLSAVVFSAIFLHERLTLVQAVGAVMILGGMLAAELFRARE